MTEEGRTSVENGEMEDGWIEAEANIYFEGRAVGYVCGDWEFVVGIAGPLAFGTQSMPESPFRIEIFDADGAVTIERLMGELPEHMAEDVARVGLGWCAHTDRQDPRHESLVPPQRRSKMIKWDQIEPYFKRLVEALETLAESDAERLSFEKESSAALCEVAYSQVDIAREALDEGRFHPSVFDLIRAAEFYKAAMSTQADNLTPQLREVQESALQALLNRAIEAEYELGE